MKTTTKKEQALNKLTNIQIKEFIMFKFRSGKNPSADEVDNTSRNYITVMSENTIYHIRMIIFYR